MLVVLACRGTLNAQYLGLRTTRACFGLSRGALNLVIIEVGSRKRPRIAPEGVLGAAKTSACGAVDDVNTAITTAILHISGLPRF